MNVHIQPIVLSGDSRFPAELGKVDYRVKLLYLISHFLIGQGFFYQREGIPPRENLRVLEGELGPKSVRISIIQQIWLK